MRAALLFAAVVAAILVSPITRADVFTFGHLRFDFDAPSPPLSGGQQALVQRLADAINRHDESALMALQDPSIKKCPAVLRRAILQNLDNAIPKTAKIRFFPFSGDFAKEMGLGDLAYLSARPTAVLGIVGSTSSQNTVKLVTIFQAVRQDGNRFWLVPYCLTPKGKAALERKH